jgi:ribosomal 50S subunit-associated protein YjgA (DUF615 family)
MTKPKARIKPRSINGQNLRTLAQMPLSEGLRHIRQDTIRGIARRIRYFEYLGRLLRLVDDGSGLDELLKSLQGPNPHLKCSALTVLQSYTKSKKFRDRRDQIIETVTFMIDNETNGTVREFAGAFFT